MKTLLVYLKYHKKASIILRILFSNTVTFAIKSKMKDTNYSNCEKFREIILRFLIAEPEFDTI